MQTSLRTDGAPPPPRARGGSRRATIPRRYLTLLLPLAAAACSDSPLSPIDEPVVFTSVAEIEAFTPAVDDLRERILLSSDDRTWMIHTMAHLSRFEAALADRNGPEAERAYASLVDDLASCRIDHCLSAPDRSVLELTLGFARNLFGRSAT